MIDELQQMRVALEGKVEELERMNTFMQGRESRIIELKQEVNGLCQQCGIPPRYRV